MPTAPPAAGPGARGTDPVEIQQRRHRRMDLILPAWSEPFTTERRAALSRLPPLETIDREWAWGGADGSGVRVAVIDSGIERDHPDVGGRLVASVRVELVDDEPRVVDDPDAIDVVGHGTACAGIVHRIAPGADLVSVRVLGPDNRGKGAVFAAGLAWAIDHGVQVVNLSLSSKSDAMYGTFHELADEAYFARVLLVCAANNVPGPSYPSLFSSVVSVAAHDLADEWAFFYNPAPPVEFGAFGLDVPVAWKDGGRSVATGNSFAAPHIAGLAALILSRHPGATPFEVKTILAATANRPDAPS
jgi:subtilisin family serine protease